MKDYETYVECFRLKAYLLDHAKQMNSTAVLTNNLYRVASDRS